MRREHRGDRVAHDALHLGDLTQHAERAVDGHRLGVPATQLDEHRPRRLAEPALDRHMQRVGEAVAEAAAHLGEAAEGDALRVVGRAH